MISNNFDHTPKEWDCLDTDLITKDGKILFAKDEDNVSLKNGDYVVVTDTKNNELLVYKYDEEHGTLIKLS